MEQHSVDRRAVIFFVKKTAEEIWPSSLPAAFLKFDVLFLQTCLMDPYAYCLAVLGTSSLIGVEFFGSRNFFDSAFLAKIIENSDFSEGRCFFHNCLHQYPIYGIPLLVRLLSFSISWVPSGPRGCAKNLLVEFSENISQENTAFWEDFCFWIHCFVLNTQLSTFGTSLLWDSIC